MEEIELPRLASQNFLPAEHTRHSKRTDSPLLLTSIALFFALFKLLYSLSTSITFMESPLLKVVSSCSRILRHVYNRF